MNAKDVARARVRRENECSEPLDGLHAEIARGEMAIVLGVFGGKHGSQDGVPIRWLKEWLKYERMPRGWKPFYSQGFFQSVKTSGDIRSAMRKLADDEDAFEDEVAQALSDSASSSGDSLLVPGEVENTTPPTSDSEDGKLVEKKVEGAQ